MPDVTSAVAALTQLRRACRSRYLAALLIVGVHRRAAACSSCSAASARRRRSTSRPPACPTRGCRRTTARSSRSPEFWRFLGNSALIAVIATVLAVGLGAMAAFALSRYTFKGREALYTLFTLGLLFPLGVATLPLYLLLRNLGLLENPLGVAIPEAAFSLPDHDRDPAAVHARDPERARGRGGGRRRHAARVLLADPAAAVAAGAQHRRDPRVRHELELLPAAARSCSTTPSHFTLPLGVAVVPVPVHAGHRAHPRVHRAVDGARRWPSSCSPSAGSSAGSPAP